MIPIPLSVFGFDVDILNTTLRASCVDKGYCCFHNTITMYAVGS